ncbi:MAG: hypothetical protein M0D54_01290 [Hyphomonadaceae bacterium JAD_PAG50586_4]|nr:MAG: hypothetical protein M0D54_01290 [Hyphomonadaceae bacterium JAD_PAG50586_4]
MAKKIAVGVVALLLCLSPAASAQDFPSEAAVRILEKQISMPANASPLDDYDRYYAFQEIEGRPIVVGVLRLRDGAEVVGSATATTIPNAYVTTLEALPVAADGGCAVVTVYFDAQTERLLPVYQRDEVATFVTAVCNGLG